MSRWPVFNNAFVTKAETAKSVLIFSRIVSELQGFELSDEVLVKPQKTTQKQPSLAKSLVKEFWGPILIAGVLKVFSDLAVFLNPYLLE